MAQRDIKLERSTIISSTFTSWLIMGSLSRNDFAGKYYCGGSDDYLCADLEFRWQTGLSPINIICQRMEPLMYNF